MKFLCQIWFDTEKSKQVTQAEWDRLTEQCILSDNRWRDSGHLLTALALREPESAVTVRVPKCRWRWKQPSPRSPATKASS